MEPPPSRLGIIEPAVTPRRNKGQLVADNIERAEDVSPQLVQIERRDLGGEYEGHASHGMNFDTPPLVGNCKEICEYSWGTFFASDRSDVLGFRGETCKWGG